MAAHLLFIVAAILPVKMSAFEDGTFRRGIEKTKWGSSAFSGQGL